MQKLFSKVEFAHAGYATHQSEHLGYHGQLFYPDNPAHKSRIKDQRLLSAVSLRACLNALRPFGSFNPDKHYDTYIKFTSIGTYSVIDDQGRFFRIHSFGNQHWSIQDQQTLTPLKAH